MTSNTGEFIDRSRVVHGDKYGYAFSIYQHSQIKILIHCHEHGMFEQIPYDHLRGRGCPDCGGSKKKTTEEFIKRANLVHEHKYDYSRVNYVNKNSNVTIICREHGVFEQQPANHLHGQGCPGCKGDRISTAKRKGTRQTLEKWISERNSDYEYDLDTFTNFLSPMRITCRKHGDFWQTPGNHFHQNQNCPMCFAANKTSRGEQDVVDYIKTLTQDVVTRCRSVISPKEIDIFIPSRNVGIEFHGLHWHADDRESTTLRTKWELCREKGVRLIQVFEDEWITKRPIVEASIRAALGMSHSVGARQLTVEEWDTGSTNTFLNTFHISGGANGSYRVGLRDKDGNGVAVLVCGKSRFTNDRWEVLRYASSCHVVGGFQRLFSKFLEDTGAESCVSYCDLRYGVGSVYEKAGFVEEGITPPDYWWFKKQVRVPRYQTQKHKLKTDPRFSDFHSPEKTEVEICMAAGYRKITGVGHKKFLFRRT